MRVVRTVVAVLAIVVCIVAGYHCTRAVLKAWNQSGAEIANVLDQREYLSQVQVSLAANWRAADGQWEVHPPGTDLAAADAQLECGLVTRPSVVVDVAGQRVIVEDHAWLNTYVSYVRPGRTLTAEGKDDVFRQAVARWGASANENAIREIFESMRARGSLDVLVPRSQNVQGIAAVKMEPFLARAVLSGTVCLLAIGTFAWLAWLGGGRGLATAPSSPEPAPGATLDNGKS